MRVMTEFENVVRASGSDDVFAFGVADAVRRDFDADAGVSSFEDLP